MPGSILIPTFRYRDAPAAIEWLCNTLGFTRHAVYENPDGSIAHAELTFGNGMIMLASASNPTKIAEYMIEPDEAGGRTGSPVYVIVPDCDRVYYTAEDNGKIVQPLETMDYGGKAFVVRDPEGYLWSVGEYDPWAARPGADEGATAKGLQ